MYKDKEVKNVKDFFLSMYDAAKWAIFKLYHGKNMLDFDEMMLMMMSTLF